MGRLMGSYIDSSLNWTDLAWLRSCTDLPIVLKGVQTASDAKKAMEMGIEGVVLSNHGGRNLDTSPPAIFVLLELQRCCPEVFDAMEVFVDGGIRRGTDILKALCLGATAVGIGRHFLYSLIYGQEGVEHLIDCRFLPILSLISLTGLPALGPFRNWLTHPQQCSKTNSRPQCGWLGSRIYRRCTRDWSIHQTSTI